MLKEHKERNDKIKKDCAEIGLAVSDKEIDCFNGGETVCSYCNEPVMVDDDRHSCSPVLFKRIEALEKLIARYIGESNKVGIMEVSNEDFKQSVDKIK